MRAWLLRSVRGRFTLVAATLIGVSVLSAAVSLEVSQAIAEARRQTDNQLMPILVESSQISNGTRALILALTQLSNSRQQFDLDEITTDIAQRNLEIRNSIAQLETLDPNGASGLYALYSDLWLSILRMSATVRQRIDAQADLDRAMREISGYTQRLQGIVGSIRRSEPFLAPESTPTLQLMLPASQALQTAISLLAELAQSHHTERVQRLAGQSGAQIALAAIAVEESQGRLDRLIPVLNDLRRVGSQEGELVQAKHALLDLERTLRGDGVTVDAALEQFSSRVSLMQEHVSAAVAQQSAVINAKSTRLFWALTASVLVPVLLAGGGFLLVDHSILRRIERLGAAMTSGSGTSDRFDIGGTDEIADMAAAARRYVEEIETRRHAAEQSAASMELALVQLHATQRTLIGQEKLASLRGVVVGVAHEINTPLGAAIGAVSHGQSEFQVIAAALRDGSLQRDQLQDFIEVGAELNGMIERSCRRIDQLVRRFKQLASESLPRSRLAHIDVGKELAALSAAMQPIIAATPHQLVIKAVDGVNIEADGESLRAVLAALIDNALSHAFPTVSTAESPARGGIISVNLRQEANWIEITVKDDGTGIPAARLPKIFEPFETTARGRGHVGLGLAIAHRLVTERLGGRITCASVEGEGTCMTLVLPRVFDQETAADAPDMPWTLTPPGGENRPSPFNL